MFRCEISLADELRINFPFILVHSARLAPDSSRNNMPPPVEEANKWVRVKVNDEYFMLNESISDTSSSDSSDNDEADSEEKSLLRKDEAVGLSALQVPIKVKEEAASPKLPNPTAVAKIPVPAALIKGTIVSTAPPTAARVIQANYAKQMLEKGSVSDLVPLRAKGNSALDTNADKNATARKRSDSFTKETPERWRMRLWPSKAITAFCRTITRCRPPASTPGVRLGSGRGSGGAGQKMELHPHWRMSELGRVPYSFDCAASHSSVFFPLAVEECREAATKAEEAELFEYVTAGTAGRPPAHNSRGNTSSSNNNNGWMEGEITAIIAESSFAPVPKPCDPRLGSVWVIAVAVTGLGNSVSFNKGGNNNNYNNKNWPGNAQSAKEGSGGELSGGDLMVLHSPQWSHPLLGVIQPWDPDYDIKFGINFAVNQSSYLNQQPQQQYGNGGSGNSGAAPVQVVNILVCVDQSDGLPVNSSGGGSGGISGGGDGGGGGVQQHQQGEIGGWAEQGTIMPGVKFSMAVIGE